jgi:hypothetical protein
MDLLLLHLLFSFLYVFEDFIFFFLVVLNIILGVCLHSSHVISNLVGFFKHLKEMIIFLFMKLLVPNLGRSLWPIG